MIFSVTPITTTRVKGTYDPMHMSQQSKRIHGSQNGSYDQNSLPAGWLDCHPYGNELNFIIPSKVHLRESFNDKIVIEKIYSPQQAILQQRRLGRELRIKQIFRSTSSRDIYKQDYVDDLCNFLVNNCLKPLFVHKCQNGRGHLDDDVASGLQDNGFQASQMTNFVEKGDTINVLGAEEMANAMGEDVTVPSEMTNDDVLRDAVPLNMM
uniref:mRNA-capping enzyme-like isoform X2 n=1 Tax=Tanacetum cinerariifolium TaxID=118510 RepID=A0A699IXY6_TANCI|nr:mRNA-capping enzyme-like isoform X2 [Tanacetum cinerariifolium]